MGLSMPARWATRRTVRPAPWRSSRSPWARAEASSDEEGTDLVAVEADSVALVAEPGPPDGDSRGDRDQTFLFGGAGEAGDGAQAPGHGGPGPAGLLQRPGVELDVGAVDREQLQAVALAPGHELAQVQGVGVSCEPSVAG
jgi:hypothetical protein